MKIIALFISLIISFSTFAQSARQIADSIRLKRRVPALVYAVISSDSIYELGGVGYKEFRTKDSISLSNRFHIGSATAAFTSFIAANLVAKGKILYNTKITKLFPEIAAKCRPEYKNITLVELLSQQAGVLPLNSYLELHKVPTFQGKPVAKRAQFVKWAVQQRSLRDTTGKRYFRFSNGNTAIAVAMLEKASGKSWEQLLEEYVNRPMGIKVRTRWPVKISGKEPNGHWNEAGKFITLDSSHWFGISPALTGACDANITIGDYIKFIQDQLRGLRGGKARLPKRSYEVLHYSYQDYSLGWVSIEVNGNHISESDGTVGTFFSHTEIIKEKNLAIITLTNSGDNYARGACLNLAKMLREMRTIL